MGMTNIHEAESNRSKLIERALRGEEVIIAMAGMPVARLVPIPRGYLAAPGRPVERPRDRRR